jgi:hypothetical protein
MDGSLNGAFHAPLPDEGLDGRPFLLLGSEEAHNSGSPTWEREWPKLDGWKRWLIVTGAAHIDYGDISVIAEQLGLNDPTRRCPPTGQPRSCRQPRGRLPQPQRGA